MTIPSVVLVTSLVNPNPVIDNQTLSPNTTCEQEDVLEVVALPPKRTLSAYNYFFRSERAKVLGIEVDVADAHNKDGKMRRHRKTHGKMGFRDMAHYVGARWKTLTDEERAPFVAMFETDRARYRSEMKVWNQQKKEHKQQEHLHVQNNETANKMAITSQTKSKNSTSLTPIESVQSSSVMPAAPATLPLVKQRQHYFLGLERSNSNISHDSTGDIIEQALAIMEQDLDLLPQSSNSLPTMPKTMQNRRRGMKRERSASKVNTAEALSEALFNLKAKEQALQTSLNAMLAQRAKKQRGNTPPDQVQSFSKMGQPQPHHVPYMKKRFEALDCRLEDMMMQNDNCNVSHNIPPRPEVVASTKQEQPALYMEDFANFDFNCDFEDRFTPYAVNGVGNTSIYHDECNEMKLVFPAKSA